MAAIRFAERTSVGTFELSSRVGAALTHVLDDGSTTNRCMMLCYPSGRPKHRRWFYVSRTGFVLWARGEKSDKSAVGFKRSKLVGVLPAAPSVSAKHRSKSFVLSTEDNQLVIIANSEVEREVWVSGCLAVIDRRSRALGAVAQTSINIVTSEAAEATRKAAESARTAIEHAADVVKSAQAHAQRHIADATTEANESAMARITQAQAEAQAEAEVAIAAAKAHAHDIMVRAEASVQEANAAAANAIAATGGEGTGGSILAWAFPDRTYCCLVCYDDFQTPGSGVSCDGAEPHFLCNDCFANGVDSFSHDDLDVQQKKDGHVSCPFAQFPPTSFSCVSAPHDDIVVARHVNSDQFRSYLLVRERLIEARLAREMEAEKEKQIQARIAYVLVRVQCLFGSSLSPAHARVSLHTFS
jgi:hypothetical protein